jgi:hypothetical protein
MRGARFAHLWLAWAFLVLLVVQFFLAGAASFRATTWDWHNTIGFFMVPGALLLLVLALLGRTLRKSTGLLLVFMVVQLVLGSAGRENEPWLGALHAVNALVLIGIAHAVATRARRASHAPGATPEPAP